MQRGELLWCNNQDAATVAADDEKIMNELMNSAAHIFIVCRRPTSGL
jgi:hypothetical protein